MKSPHDTRKEIETIDLAVSATQENAQDLTNKDVYFAMIHKEKLDYYFHGEINRRYAETLAGLMMHQSYIAEMVFKAVELYKAKQQ